MNAIGRYEVLERIGIGGMGEVFRCRSTGVEGFQKDVVVKMVLPDMEGEEEFERAFVDEAKLSVLLQHPNIVQTLDLGKHEGRLYLVMEYVDGHDLGAALRILRRQGKAMPLAVGVQAAIELLRGLDHAHRAIGSDGRPLEIIHRDVTPGNVMASFAGAVKLADFGIARFTSRSQAKTTTGFVKGKVAFMPPEQVESRPLTPATDVFSAALVLSTLLMGKHPLETASEAELLDRIRAGNIPLPGTVAPGIPRSLDAIIAKALKPRLEDRTQTAAALLEELEGFVLDEKLRTGPAVVSAFMHETFRDELAKREKDRGSGAHVAAVATVTPTPTLAPAQPVVVSAQPVVVSAPSAGPDVANPATRSVPARPVGRRLFVIAPLAVVALAGLGAAGWLGRERALLASLRNDCEGEWRVVSEEPIIGVPPGERFAFGSNRRVIVKQNADGGVRVHFKTAEGETLSVPLDLERDGATVVGRYNGIPVKFFPGPAGDFVKAERMNLRVRLNPLGTVLNIDFEMFGEGIGSRQWAITAER